MSTGAALGPFPVVGTAAEAAAFRAATGDAGGDPAHLPMAFPVRWLAAPAVRAALGELAAGAVLVHEAQTFVADTPLRVDTPYRLHLQARREDAPDRLVLEATITDATISDATISDATISDATVSDATVSDEAGRERARCETVLRLLDVAGAAA